MDNKSINEVQDEIIEEFKLVTDSPLVDSFYKYVYIKDVGAKLPVLSDNYKNEVYSIKGCQSIVYLHAFTKDDNVIFEGDSESDIIKGIVGLFIRILSNRPPREILDADLYFIDKCNLAEHFTSKRSNGLNAMLNKMREYAIYFEKIKEFK